MNRTKKIAFCGIITALCVVLMFLTTVIPVGTYALSAVAGAILVLVVIECGAGFAFSVFAAVSILSILLVPDKVCVLSFIAFMGHYPIIKRYIERINKRWIEYVVKLFVVNLAIAASVAVAICFMNVPVDLLYRWGYIAIFVALAAADTVFLVYDVALTNIISAYIHKYRKKFGFLIK